MLTSAARSGVGDDDPTSASEVSTSVFQAWQDGHRPAHLRDGAPHAPHR